MLQSYAFPQIPSNKNTPQPFYLTSKSWVIDGKHCGWKLIKHELRQSSIIKERFDSTIFEDIGTRARCSRDCASIYWHPTRWRYRMKHDLALARDSTRLMTAGPVRVTRRNVSISQVPMMRLPHGLPAFDVRSVESLACRPLARRFARSRNVSGRDRSRTHAARPRLIDTLPLDTGCPA